MLTEALEIAHRTGERYHEAELYQLKGELSLQSAVRSLKSLAPNTQHLAPKQRSTLKRVFTRLSRLLVINKRSRWSCGR